MSIAENADTLGDRRLWTIADVAALPSVLPSGPVEYELIRGSLVMMSPTGDLHGLVQARFVFELMKQGDKCGLGTTRTEVGLVIRRDPDTLLAPDVMFLATGKLPPRVSAEGWWETIPTIVVEVRSKNDTRRELADKAETYLAAGVEWVWVADPQQKIVTEYRRGADPVDRGVDQVLTAEPRVPGFRLPLAELFAESPS